MKTVSRNFVLLASVFFSQTLQSADSNLIQNGSLDQGEAKNPPGWVRAQSGLNEAYFAVLDWGAWGRWLYVSIGEYSSGEAGWAFKPVHVTPGKTYVWSSTFKKEGRSVIRAEFKLTSGKTVTQDVDVLIWGAEENWVTISREFVAPPEAVSVSVCHCLTGRGSIYFKEVSLVEQ